MSLQAALLDLLDIDGLEALVSLLDLELDGFALGETAEAFAGDVAIVDERVAAAVVEMTDEED